MKYNTVLVKVVVIGTESLTISIPSPILPVVKEGVAVDVLSPSHAATSAVEGISVKFRSAYDVNKDAIHFIVASRLFGEMSLLSLEGTITYCVHIFVMITFVICVCLRTSPTQAD